MGVGEECIVKTICQDMVHCATIYMEDNEMPKKVESYYITESARKRFKKWLFENELTFRQFSIRCDVSRQYLDKAIKGIIPITDSVREHFKKGGYEYL